MQENQTVKVKVLSMENGKISLSIKKAFESKASGKTVRPPVEAVWGSAGNENMSFEDRLSKYMKDSDERMHDLKKNFESKRGGGSYRRSAQYY